MINDYKIPGGLGGLAVRFACHLIMKEPGIMQSELLKRAVSYSGLNLSTAGWLTSPSDKSPACKLWNREKSGRAFRLYPNEHTQAIAQTLVDKRRENTSEKVQKAKKSQVSKFARELRQGDILELDHLSGVDGRCRGVILGFKIGNTWRSETGDGLSETPEEAFEAWNVDELHIEESFETMLKIVVLTEDSEIRSLWGDARRWIGRLISDPPPVWKVRVKNTFTPDQYYPGADATGNIPVGFTLWLMGPGDSFTFCIQEYMEREERSSWKTESSALAVLDRMIKKTGFDRQNFEVVCI